MEKESRSLRASRGAPEPGLFLQWGTRKRPRCSKPPDGGSSSQSHSKRRRANRRIVRAAAEKELLPPPPPPPLPPHPTTLHHHHHHHRSESAGSESRKSSPEKEDRFYTTRGSAAAAPVCEDGGNGNGNGAGAGEVKGAMDIPRFFLSLSNKEKEEDFLAMKGCRLPQRPKKRSKCIQKSILLVSPGTWLMDLSQERYEVREKKSSKKKKRGLKAMFVDSDSE